MSRPILLLIIILSLAVLITVILLLKITLILRIRLDKELSIKIHIKLYKIKIYSFNYHYKKKRKKKKNKIKIPNLKFINTKLRLYGAIGLLDAKNTALAAGGLYSLFGGIICGLGHLTNLKNLNLRVDPIYNCNRLFLESDCIAKAKVGNIIIAYIRYLIIKRK